MENKYCLKCGREVTDPEAVFCGGCGARLDGKLICKACGKELDKDDYLFCVRCGARLGNDGALTAYAKRSAGFGAHKSKNTASLLSFISDGIAAALMLIVLAFTFCIGLKVTVTTSGVSVSDSSFLYDCFGDSYDVIKDNYMLSTLGGAQKFALYFPVVLSTIVSALAILSAAAFCALSVWSFIRKYVFNKENVNVGRFPAIAFLAYLGCSIALMGLTYMKLDYFFKDDNITVIFHGATIAGIVIGFVLLASRIVISYIISGKKCDSALRALLSALLLAFSLVCALLTMYSVFGIFSNTGSSSTTLKMGFAAALQSAGAYESGDALVKFLVLSTIGLITGIAALVIWLKILYDRLSAPYGESKRLLTLVLTSVATALSVVYLLMAVFSGRIYCDAAGINENCLRTGAIPIVMLVIAVLGLVDAVFNGYVIDKLSSKAVESKETCPVDSAAAGETAATDAATVSADDSAKEEADENAPISAADGTASDAATVSVDE